MHLAFIKDTHKYLLDGREVPSVTRIINEVVFPPMPAGVVDPAVIARALQFGSHVHEMLLLSDQGKLDMSRLDSELVPYLEVYGQFLRYARPVYSQMEQPVGSARFGYAGTPDRVCQSITVKGKTYHNVILDFKTGAKASTLRTQVQTMGYRLAFMEYTGELASPTRVGLYLKADGYDLELYTDPGDEAVFLAGVSLYKFRYRNNLLK